MSQPSKARLVITALFVDHQTPAEVAARYGVHRPGSTSSWPATRPRARPPSSPAPDAPRPHRRATPPDVGRPDPAAPQGARPTPAWTPAPTPSPGTSSTTTDTGCRGPPSAGILARAGLVTPEPKKRPKSSYIRFEASHAERDLAVRLHPLPAHPTRRPTRHGRRDHHLARRLHPLRPARHRPRPDHQPDRHQHLPRKPLASTASRLHADRQRHGLHRPPRRRGRQGGRNASRPSSDDWHVVQKNSRPSHPTTCGKVETLPADHEEVATRPTRPARHDRRAADPARPLRRPSTTTTDRTAPCPTEPPPQRSTTPMPKALPGPSRDPDTHDRIRHDRVDKAGTVTLRVARPTAPHRHRPNPRRNPRHPAHPGPPRPRRQRRHRRTPPRAHHRPHTATTSPPDTHRTHPEMTTAEPTIRRSGCRRCPETSHWSG